jgi:hypothetical protein
MTAKTVKSKKAKGMKFQKEIVQKLLSTFSELTENDIRSIPSSVPGTDIWLSERALKKIPLDVEAKAQEKLNIWGAIKQVELRCKLNLIPVVIFKKNHTQPYVCLNLNDFLKILERYAINEM